MCLITNDLNTSLPELNIIKFSIKKSSFDTKKGCHLPLQIPLNSQGYCIYGFKVHEMKLNFGLIFTALKCTVSSEFWVIDPIFCGNFACTQNFQARKLDEISAIYGF